MLNSRTYFFLLSLSFLFFLSWLLDSAGGGGKSKARKTKIKEKNEKLAEERAKIAKDNSKKKQKQEQNGKANDEFAGIHPSRLNMMA